MNWKDIQSVVQVRAEMPLTNLALQVAVRRRDHTNVRLDGPVAADPLEFLFLQDPQERDLHFRRQLADFVEEDRSAIRRLETSDPLLQGSRERALFVAEQLAGDEFGRERRTIHLHESTPRARRPPVDGVCDEFLSRTRFSGDQYGRIGRGNAIDDG